MRRFASIDLLLTLLIIGSAGFIAYRFVENKKTQPTKDPSTIAAVTSSAVAAKSAEEIQKEAFIKQYGKIYGTRIQDWASTHWRMDAEKWQKALYHTEVRPAVVNATKSCEGNATQLPALFVITPELRAHYEKNTPETVFDIGNRRCWKLGQVFEVAYLNLAFGDNLDKPFLEYAGTTRVQSLVELNRATSSSEMLATFGETKEFLTEFFTGVDDPKATYVLARVGPRTKSPKEVPKIIHYYPRTKILSRANLQNELSKPYLILDVRSAAEIATKPLPEALAKNSINAPFQIAGSKPNVPLVFDWNITLRQIQSAKFDVAKLLDIASNRQPQIMIFIGASPTDARPLFAIKESLESGLENLAWYTDGADALP